jgi:hypothetical protein
MTGKTAMIPLFLNLLSLIAPTLWVLASGALGVGIGAYGPKLLARLKNDCAPSTTNPDHAATLPQRGASRRASRPRKTKPRIAPRRPGRKRPRA